MSRTAAAAAAATPRPAPDPARLLAAIGQAVFVVDPRRRVTSWNQAAEVLYGWSSAEAIGRDSRSLMTPVGLVQNGDEIFAELLAGRSYSGGFTVQRKDGTLVRVAFTNSPVLAADGMLESIVVVARSLHATVAPLLDNCREAVLVVGGDARIHFASRAVQELFGWSPDQLMASRVLALVHPADRGTAIAMGQHIVNQASPHQGELRFRGVCGEWRWANVSVTNLLDEPTVQGLVVHLHDITERRAQGEQLRRLRQNDALTGLPNRGTLLTRVADAEPDRGVAGALLVVKVDGLQASAQQLGHVSGDEALRTVARRLSAALGPADSAGVLGDGEFGVLAEEVSTPADTAALVERLQLAVARPVQVGLVAIIPTLSVGSTLLLGRRRSHELLREATTAMHAARAAGPDRHQTFAATGSDPTSPGGPLTRLATALTSGELVVHYQPVVDLGGRTLVGVEALLRWQHPRQGLLTAGAFLQVAEADDLINDIGAFVLQQACAEVAGWSGDPLTLSVNLSGRQLSDPTLPASIDQALARSALDPTRLVLEITEAALLEDLPTARRTLEHCRTLGIRISIDDFGTGFAGYNYLRDLPVDEIKIDRSFTAGVAQDSFDAAIVGGIVHMAHQLGLRTTAEGIETEQQAAALTTLGCDLGQGFLWSSAQPGHPPALPRPRTAPAAVTSPAG